MFKKRLLLASYPLLYLGLFIFTYWVTWQHVHLVDVSNLSKVLLTLGVLFTFVLIPLMIDGSYFESLLIEFAEQTQQKCRGYFSYLDRVSLGLFISLVVSIFLGESVYSQVTEFMFYLSLGLYISSSAVILLFTSKNEIRELVRK